MSVQRRIIYLLDESIKCTESRNNPFFDYRFEQIVDGLTKLLAQDLKIDSWPFGFIEEHRDGRKIRRIILTAPPIGGGEKKRIKTYPVLACDNGVRWVTETGPYSLEEIRRATADTANAWRRWSKSPDFPKPSLPILSVDADKCIVWLDDQRFDVTDEQADFIGQLIKAKGSPMSFEGRTDRLYDKLPVQIQSLIEKKSGAGYWINRAKVDLE